MNNFQMPMPNMMQTSQIPGRAGAAPTNDSTTLYVGNLDSDLTEQRLYEFFSQYGSVVSVRIMRDLYSGESRGFAFVNFTNQADAQRAKQVLNHSKIQNREIRISFKRNPGQNNTDANLFVSNLDPKVTSQELEELCKEYGNVVSCYVRQDDNGQSIGYGYVQFENEKGADDCISGLHGQKMYEKEIDVQKFVPRSKRPNKNKRNNLYLKSFPDSFDEPKVREFIKEAFKDYGDIESVGIFRDNKLNKIYAFVAFQDGDKAKEAAKMLNGHEFDEGVTLYVDFAQSKTQRKRMLKQKHQKFKNETNLYIRSLKVDVTEEQLKQVFSKYGAINSTCIKKHKFPSKTTDEDKELQFGFVNFPNIDEAKAAYTNAKKDEEIKDLIHPSAHDKGDFIFYAQPKNVRSQYLRMIKKNFRTTQMLQNNMFSLAQNQFRQMMGGNMRFPGGKRAGGRRGQRKGKMDNMNMMNMMPMMQQVSSPFCNLTPFGPSLTFLDVDATANAAVPATADAADAATTDDADAAADPRSSSGYRWYEPNDDATTDDEEPATNDGATNRPTAANGTGNEGRQLAQSQLGGVQQFPIC